MKDLTELLFWCLYDLLLDKYAPTVILVLVVKSVTGSSCHLCQSCMFFSQHALDRNHPYSTLLKLLHFGSLWFYFHTSGGLTLIQLLSVSHSHTVPRSLQLSRAGLRLQGKQLLPTNHPSLLETGFSPSLSSPPRHHSPVSSVAAAPPTPEHMSLAVKHFLCCRTKNRQAAVK